MINVNAPVTLPNDTALIQVIQLFLIRHGNARKRRGETYVTAPLTELGRQQAKRTGDYFKQQGISFDGFYSSSLLRAVETANLIGAEIGQTPTVRGGIQEMEYREIPATILAELFTRTGVLNRYLENRIGKAVRYPMIGRVANGLLEILAQHAQGQIGLVVHGGVISSVLSWYFPRERRRWWRETVGNCSITHLEISNGRAALREFDFTAHLGNLASTAHQRNYTFTGDEGV